MIKHTNEGREYLFVEVPEGSHRHHIGPESYTLWYRLLGDEKSDPWQYDRIPDRNYYIISMASEATESQAAEIVEYTDADFADDNEPPDLKRFYRDYNDAFACYTAIESLQSLLTSHGLKMDGTLILVKL